MRILRLVHLRSVEEPKPQRGVRRGTLSDDAALGSSPRNSSGCPAELVGLALDEFFLREAVHEERDEVVDGGVLDERLVVRAGHSRVRSSDSSIEFSLEVEEEPVHLAFEFFGGPIRNPRESPHVVAFVMPVRPWCDPS
jgi:hypothetical protein